MQLYTQQYDYAISKYSKTKLGNYKTDKNGFFSIDEKKESNDRGYFLQIEHEKDRLFLDDLIYNYQYYGEEPIEKEEQKRIFFFTDRSIYRPGQTVYFKGIAITNNNEGNSIAANYKAGIYLRNANYEVVDSLQLTTNEFGSFNGKFTLFQNTLNGDFQIVDKQNQNTVSFSVEEYKRPKFFVEFEKVKDTYKVDDTVTISANAKAYAGNNIDGAKVSYRIVRQPRFIYPWIMWRGWFPQ